MRGDMARTMTENIVVRTDPSLKREIERFAADHAMSASELMRLAIVGLMKEAEA